jgi:probable HAF family extracellular repeat protein
MDLGTLDGNPTLGRAVNTSGQVAGFSDGVNQGNEQAFRTGANSAINSPADKLGTLGGTFSEAYGLNDGGQAVGLAGLPGNFFYHAFRTTAGGAINANSDLGTLIGPGPGGYSLAYAVNVHGQAVGVSEISGSFLLWPARAFRTAANQKINSTTDKLGTLGGSYSEARDINSSGQVVGSAYLAGDAAYHAFRTAANAAINGGTDDLGTLGGTKSAAVSINDVGQVAGSSQVAGDGAWRAFRVAANTAITPTDQLDTLGGTDSWATAINSSGAVVGRSLLPDGTQHAFLCDGTTMWDLNDLIPAGSGWVLTEANSINDSYQIAGTGLLAGVKHAYLLTCASGHCTVVRGDVNCDGLVNNGDIDAFVLALTDSATYAAQFPGCNILSADINGDRLVNNGDIDAFVALLTGG